MQLRVHHILCAPLFIGKGYSEEFVENMQTVVDQLQQDVEVSLQIEPDVICGSCPNYLRDKQQCKLDQNHVKTKDAKLVEILSLEIREPYTAKKIFSEMKDKMTEEIFENSCQKCEWYRQGLCRYEKYKRNIERFINKNNENDR